MSQEVLFVCLKCFKYFKTRISPSVLEHSKDQEPFFSVFLLCFRDKKFLWEESNCFYSHDTSELDI